MDPTETITRLALEPHPEGGHYRRTFADPEGRASAILYLVSGTEPSRWHRVDATEIWCSCAGAPIEVEISVDAISVTTSRLGTTAAARPQVVVPPNTWQRARPTGGAGLVTCLVVPAFRWDAFDLAPEGWEPGRPGWEGGPPGGRL